MSGLSAVLLAAAPAPGLADVVAFESRGGAPIAGVFPPALPGPGGGSDATVATAPQPGRALAPAGDFEAAGANNDSDVARHGEAKPSEASVAELPIPSANTVAEISGSDTDANAVANAAPAVPGASAPSGWISGFLNLIGLRYGAF